MDTGIRGCNLQASEIENTGLIIVALLSGLCHLCPFPCLCPCEATFGVIAIVSRFNSVLLRWTALPAASLRGVSDFSGEFGSARSKKTNSCASGFALSSWGSANASKKSSSGSFQNMIRIQTVQIQLEITFTRERHQLRHFHLSAFTLESLTYQPQSSST